MIFRLYNGLGDAVVANGVAHNYFAQTGEKLKVNSSRHHEVFQNSPYLQLTDEPPEVKLVHKEGLQKARTCNQVAGVTRFLSDVVRKHIHIYTDKPQLYFTQEQLPRVIEKPYVLLCFGWYDRCNVKNIGRVQAQNIINANPDITFVQSGILDQTHHQPMLYGDNIINMINRTPSVREFAALCKHASMAIGPVSSFSHICACYDTPTAIIIGNRQPAMLTTYPFSHHITSKSPCGPCMAFKAFGNINAQGPICRYIANVGQQVIPQCMVFKDIHVKFRELYDKYARK